MTALMKAARAMALASLTAAAGYAASTGESASKPLGEKPNLNAAKDDDWRLVYDELSCAVKAPRLRQMKDLAGMAAA